MTTSFAPVASASCPGESGSLDAGLGAVDPGDDPFQATTWGEQARQP
jgi:hypothetical protein